MFHNGIEVKIIPSKFSYFKFCFPIADIDFKNDKFKLQSSGQDGVSHFSQYINDLMSLFEVCISGLWMNDDQILVGRNKDLPYFVLDSTDNFCTSNKMRTNSITIQNGKVIESQCIDSMDGFTTEYLKIKGKS